MKALRSALANRLLADPVARLQLRHFSETAAGAAPTSVVDLTVELKQDGKTVVYQPIVVAKAA